ncbi:uncharacterized protein DUF4405 [Arcicella aurantiaca]|uniref:Uncharacterized protein DUF4405 n=1 Tax=Arcicella aurantiaca TaxID=591202 RepID=A0A316EK71_9BACT|nr:DUF4405 domain-containing protein [Arcicella aurantiaca]PWK23360.1 uncharacterized protein DUF4405 [Arcicella aurantiaca]
MKRKNIISLTIGFAFLAIAITGILLYIKQKSHAAEITHTIFGLIFIGFAIFHIVNNWSSITGYSKERKSGKIQKELIVASAIFGVVLIGSVTEVFEPIAEAGRIFAKKRQRPENLSFEEIKTNQDSKGTALRVLVEKNKETKMPVVAIWVEDSTHKFVENLYVPAKEAQTPKSEEEAKEGKFELSDFKPESLPTWQAKTASKLPLSEKDTPHENFVVNSKTTAKGTFYVLLEVKSEGKTEVYETKVSGGISKLTSKDNALIKSGLVEIL